MIYWDTEFIFATLGGRQGIIQACAKYAPESIPPSPASVSVWKSRRAIAADWLPVLVHAVFEKLAFGKTARAVLRDYALPAPNTNTMEDVGL